MVVHVGNLGSQEGEASGYVHLKSYWAGGDAFGPVEA